MKKLIIGYFIFLMLISCSCPTDTTKEIPQEVQEVLGKYWTQWILIRADEIKWVEPGYLGKNEWGYAKYEFCFKCEHVMVHLYCYRTIYVVENLTKEEKARMLVHEAAHHDIDRDICDIRSEEYARSTQQKFDREKIYK